MVAVDVAPTDRPTSPTDECPNSPNASRSLTRSVHPNPFHHHPTRDQPEEKQHGSRSGNRGSGATLAARSNSIVPNLGTSATAFSGPNAREPSVSPLSRPAGVPVMCCRVGPFGRTRTPARALESSTGFLDLRCPTSAPCQRRLAILGMACPEWTPVDNPRPDDRGTRDDRL